MSVCGVSSRVGEDDVQFKNNSVSFLISGKLDIVDTANQVSH